MVPVARFHSTFVQHRFPNHRLLASIASRFVVEAAERVEPTKFYGDPTAVAAVTVVVAVAVSDAVAAVAVAEVEAGPSVVVAVVVARIAELVAAAVAAVAEVLVAAATREDSWEKLRSDCSLLDFVETFYAPE